MSLKTDLALAIKNADEFYKVDGQNVMIAHQYGAPCYKVVCFKPECGCNFIDSCDYKEGETIKQLFPTAIEIEQPEFEALFIECYSAHQANS